jgi:hypothetical protein
MLIYFCSVAKMKLAENRKGRKIFSKQLMEKNDNSTSR